MIFYKLSLKSIYYVTIRNYVKFSRLFKISIVPNLLDPILFLLAMGLGLSGLISDVNGTTYLLFVMSGLVASTAMNTATADATVNAFIQMRIEKTYALMAVTPVNLQDIVIAQAIWGGIRSIIFGGSFLIISLIIGQTFNLYVLLVPIFLFLTGFAFSLLGLIVTIAITNKDYLNYYNTLIIRPMYMFSDTFFPVNQMPEWLQKIAWFSPLYHAVNLCRAMILGDPSNALGHLVWLIVFILILFYIPIILINLPRFGNKS